MGSTAARALVRQGTNDRAELGLDQGLIDRLGRLADPVIDLGGLQCIQDFQQGRLVQGHRVLCPSARTIGVGLADHHTVALLRASGTPSGPGYLHHQKGRGPRLHSVQGRGLASAGQEPVRPTTSTSAPLGAVPGRRR